MDASTYQTIKRLYLEARELPREDRKGFLEQRCAGQGELQSEVEGLLAGSETLGEFLSKPAGAMGGPEPDELSHPERIGAYRIHRPLGFGGMGVVYLAEQDSPRRLVALKLLRSDSASPRQLERFEQEAQLLGRLSHPGIAAVYEAGWTETETGKRPFFAMEYVEGRELLEFANEHRLDLPTRLRLACQVAEAAHYAHERGIVHRDLKPSNVLVDVRGEPKVLDFGVARALGSDSHATQTGQLVGTLSHMSPEQASGGGEVDRRSDVYSLGVILYELLTGRPPVPTEGLALHEAVRRVREEDPIAAGAVRKELKGDLETILGKALAKEPGRRYASAAELAEDLRLFLEHRPIRARRPTSLYVAWKLVRRHRALTVTALALFVVLSLTQYGWLALTQRSREVERMNQARTFWRELSVRHRILDEVKGLERQGQMLENLTSGSSALLEEWLGNVERVAGRLPEHRQNLEQTQSWVFQPAATHPIVTKEEKEYALEIQTEIVERIEAMTGPRGPLPVIRARLDKLHEVEARGISGEGRR